MLSFHHLPLPGCALLALIGAAHPVLAQVPEPAREVPRIAPLVGVGSTAEDRIRLDQILGRQSPDGFLVRSPSRLTPALPVGPGHEVRWSVIAPEIHTVRNSALPLSLNEGTLWAGRGLGIRTTAGARVRVGPVQATLAPQVTYHQNLPFQIIPNRLPGRKPFAHPWHTLPESMDMPMRFGDEPFTVLSFGQSSLSVDAGPVTVGVTSEDQWWGPGMRNAILMSNNGPGIPRAFARTASPVRTRVGSFDAHWMVGRLNESDHFDDVPGNHIRFLSGVAATYTPVWEPNLTVGLSRAVFGPLRGDFLLRRGLDVLRDVGRPNARPVTDLEREPGPDQLFSLFGRWIFPVSGAEVYAEWARHERPISLRDFLVEPHHTQGYTLGMQWATPVGGATARLQAEATNLEMSSTYRHRRVATFYKSRPVQAGYTHRGQVIGAAIGPGASSQWIGADYVAPSWHIGVVAGRIRWENDAHYAVYPWRNPAGHDVSVLGGLRGGAHVRGVEVTAEWIHSKRYNYLFQNWSPSFDDIRAVDVRNNTLRLTIIPTLPLR